jgi:hypothetical protein
LAALDNLAYAQGLLATAAISRTTVDGGSGRPWHVKGNCRREWSGRRIAASGVPHHDLTKAIDDYVGKLTGNRRTLHGQTLSIGQRSIAAIFKCRQRCAAGTGSYPRPTAKAHSGTVLTGQNIPTGLRALDKAFRHARSGPRWREITTGFDAAAAARPYADPEVAARELIEPANSVEAVQDGRIHIELINGPMLFELKATPAE